MLKLSTENVNSTTETRAATLQLGACITETISSTLRITLATLKLGIATLKLGTFGYLLQNWV